MTTLFKVGDRAKCIQSQPQWLIEGAIYYVFAVATSDYGQHIQIAKNDTLQWWEACRFQLIRPSANFTHPDPYDH